MQHIVNTISDDYRQKLSSDSLCRSYNGLLAPTIQAHPPPPPHSPGIFHSNTYLAIGEIIWLICYFTEYYKYANTYTKCLSLITLYYRPLQTHIAGDIADLNSSLSYSERILGKSSEGQTNATLGCTVLCIIKLGHHWFRYSRLPHWTWSDIDLSALAYAMPVITSATENHLVYRDSPH